jgi:hypothetical protein
MKVIWIYQKEREKEDDDDDDDRENLHVAARMTENCIMFG